MALVVNTNIGSINAQRQLAGTTRDMSTAMERLSSGKRINTAADDAAGLAISTRMTSQVKGLNMAIRNANDGISLTQTAEGAMQEVTDMLQRMRELAVQASSGAASDSDRASLDDEVTQLKAEIDRISSSTRFNNVAILDGSYAVDVQIGDQADQRMGISVSSVATNAMGETVDGLADEATGAELVLTGMSTNAADYSGKTFDVTVNGVTSTVTLPTADDSVESAAQVTAAFAGEDTGDATSILIASDTAGYLENVIDLSTHANRVFSVRNDRGEFVDIDFTEQLMTELGVTRAELDDPSTYSSSESDKVTKSQFLTAVQAALDAEATLQGDNRVIVSVNEYGAINFADVDGDSSRIALQAGNISGEATAGTFLATYVDSTLTGDTSSNVINVDFTDVLEAAFKVKVNDDDEWTEIDINDKLDDSDMVYDRNNVMAYELVNALQAEFDENFSGEDAVTVGITENGQLTIRVAGDGTNAKVTFSESEISVAGTMTATTGLASLFGMADDEAIDNTINQQDWSAVDSLTDPRPWENTAAEDWGFAARLNDGGWKNIELISYIRDMVSNTSEVTMDEAVAVLQTALDDNFGAGAITVSMDQDGYLEFDPTGKGVFHISELDAGVTGTTGTFVTSYIDSDGELEINEYHASKADNAERTGDISYGVSSSSDNVTELLDAFFTNEQGYFADDGTRMMAFADTIYTGTVAAEWTSAGAVSSGIDLDTTAAAITFSIDGTDKTEITLTEGFYASIEDVALELQHQINRSGEFAGTDALTVSVKTYTDGDNLGFGQQVKYLAVENAYGKVIEIDAAEAKLFGAETDTDIDDTTNFQEMGIRPNDTDGYITHDLIDGGVNTVDNAVSLTVEKDGNTYSYSLNLDAEENMTFSDFASGVVAKANEAFAAHGLSFTGGIVDGQFSFAIDQAGASTVTLSGTAADQAFGGSVTASGADASPGIADMNALAAEITADLTSVGVEASYDESTQALSIRDASGTTGSESTLAIAGADLADVQIAGTLSATGVASNATGARLSTVSVGTVDDATAALNSIDNAIEYISNQRGELGAIENRLTHTVNNLMNVVENTSAARSRIEDADYAVESANLAKLQVMQQAGTAMLAQANASGQLVLSLLG